MNDPLSLQFQKLTGDGKGLAYYDGRAIFAEGVLPGETASVRLTKQAKSYAEATVQAITTPLPERTQPREDHYLACSPWQNLPYERQIQFKRQMLEELFGRLDVPSPRLMSAPQPLGYRNKLEYLLITVDNSITLGFHHRGMQTGVVAPDGCVLASPAMNQAATMVVDRLNTMNLANLATGLTVRSSQSGQIVVGIVLEKAVKRDWQSLRELKLHGICVNVRDGHRRYRMIWSRGELELEDELQNVAVRYPWASFFQTNLPLFEQVMGRITAVVPPEAAVLDLYGGVGTIGLILAARGNGVTNVELAPLSAEAARANALRLDLGDRYDVLAQSSGRVTGALMDEADSVVVDPPRAGLDKYLVRALLASGPEQIVYLSCNPVTLGRDLASLASAYRAVTMEAYDFYPGTPHLEALAILERHKK